MNARRDRYPIILATLAVAALLMLLPLPNWLQAAWPYWMALTLIYWCLETQGRITLGLGFTVGIVLDLLMGSLLGLHALCKTLLAIDGRSRGLLWAAVIVSALLAGMTVELTGSELAGAVALILGLAASAFILTRLAAVSVSPSPTWISRSRADITPAA